MKLKLVYTDSKKNNITYHFKCPYDHGYKITDQNLIIYGKIESPLFEHISLSAEKECYCLELEKITFRGSNTNE